MEADFFKYDKFADLRCTLDEEMKWLRANGLGTNSRKAKCVNEDKKGCYGVKEVNLNRNKQAGQLCTIGVTHSIVQVGQRLAPALIYMHHWYVHVVMYHIHYTLPRVVGKF